MYLPLLRQEARKKHPYESAASFSPWSHFPTSGSLCLLSPEPRGQGEQDRLMFSSLLLKRFSLANLQKRSWLQQNCIPIERKPIVTSLRSTPGLIPDINAICHYDFSFLLRRCVFLLVFPCLLRRSLFVSKRRGWGERNRRSPRGTMGRGNREERPFPTFSLFP